MNTHQAQASKAASLIGQRGVGLIEVLIALFVLAFGSLAISNMHTDSLMGLKVSSTHLQVNSISNEIAEYLKSDPDEANTGTYNTAFSDLSAASGLPTETATLINSWKQLTAQSLPAGQLNIQCATDLCTVSVQWRESHTDGVATQTYNVRVPL
jgi:type IV pilus assembly protein PilV